ncbi:hypothetical protein GF366_05050, partial [Candidatus Peregrinibacteria bacterium]|nr:hypothetical protein [Candidatus Peregrinibacteria bacterium]
NSPFESDVTLDVNIESYEDKLISSMIIHDEPTSYTIMEQLKSMGTLSLPIDDPRYVVFQSAPVPLPNYPAPQPINENIDVDEILENLNLAQYYFPGKIQKIEYPNLFQTDNFAQLEADLSSLANKLALMPKSFRVFGEDAAPGDYSVLDIRNEILNNYLLPTVNGLADHPNDFDLEIAATEKIYDALEWLNFNIDQKHEYVLKNYLNGSKNAFAGDATLVPSYSGYETSFGYEAAYLVLDGDGYSFNMSFNKDLPEETNEAFDPLAPYREEGEEPEFAVDEFAMEEEEAEQEEGNGLKFVDLDQFLKELNEFINYFSTTPDFQDVCVFADWAKKQNKKEKEGIEVKEENIAKSQQSLELDPGTINISLEKDVIKADGIDQFSVKVLGNTFANDLVSLEIDQSEINPVIDFYDSNSKSLSDGEAKFKFISTGNVGTAFISAETDSGITSNTVSVKSVGTGIDFVSYTYFKPEGMEELEAAIEKQEELEGLEEEEVEEELEGLEEEGMEEELEGMEEEGVVVSEEEAVEEIEEPPEIMEEISEEEEEFIVREVKKEILEKELEGALSDISEEEAEGIPSVEKEPGAGEEEVVEVEEVLEEAEEETEEPDITVLTSEPVVEETEEKIEEEKETVEEPVEEIEEIEAEEIEEIEESFEEWEEYFLLKDYYNKFIDSGLSYLFDSRLVAEVISDRMIAYLPESENPFIEASENEDSKYILTTSDEMTADGESLMMLNVSISDENGLLETDKKHTVKFRAEPDLVTFENGNIVETENGVATVYLRAGTVAGPFTVYAEVLDANGEPDTNYPTDSGTELYLSSGEITDIDIKSDSYVLLANNQSKTNLNFTLKDKFGNIANDSFAQIALFIGDGNKAYFDEAADSNNQILGTQLSTIEGHADVDLYSNDEAGEINIIALLLDYELEEEFIEAGKNWEEINFSEYTGNSKTFKILDDVSLEIIPDALSIPADGDSTISIRTELRSDGKTVEGYNGPINFSILNDNLGNFVSLPPEKMVNGVLHEANVKFRSSTLAGEPEILIEVPGFVSENLNLKTLPGEPVEIELSSSADTIYSDGIEEVVLKARLLDKYENLADTNNNTVVSFSTTDATEGFIEFTGAQNALSLDGIAATTITGGDISGEANIIADSEGVEADSISLNITKHISVINEEIEEFSPRALYISLLGGNFGTLSVENNLSQALLHSGQVQAVSSVTATPNENKRLFGVDGYGKIDILSDTVEMKAIPATGSFPYQKIVFSDYVADEELASVFIVPKESELILVDEETQNFNNEGIYVERISEVDEDIKFNKKEDGIFIDKSGETKVKIDNFGRIYINDPLLEMKVPEEEDNIMTDNFSFIIYDRGEVLAHIYYNQDFTNLNGEAQNVINISYDSDLSAYYPGIYLKLNTPSKKYDVVSCFSRASTEEPMGFYMVDTENEIDPVHAPGFSFDSLEDAKNNFGLGFRGNNKHMLLFSGGNSVGESHIPYATDAGIIYGDPTIRLEIDGIVGLVSELSGYSKDIGRSLFSGKEEILEIINFDYNGDGMDDILLAYEDGLVRLLENEISNRRFNDRGYILNVDGGIYSTAKIDVNNDGYDDLIVGSKESCLEGEVSVSLYTNNGGNFERETLALDISGKVFEMKSTDMNQDGCDDLVLSDSAGNVRVFYNQNDGDVCTGLEKNFGNTFNFGFSINGEINSSNNLYINYVGMEQLYEGSAGLNYEDSNADKFISFVLESDQAPESGEEGAEFAESATEMQESLLANENIATKDIPPQTYPKEYNFIHIGEDPRFGINSTKFGIDENGGNVDIGDKINYVITLENSGAYVNNLILSDLTPVTMTLDTESLECLDANCEDDLQWEETDNSVRSHVIKNITVPANGKRTIKYTMTVESVPEVRFDVGNFIDDEGTIQYPDILVKPEFNPEGVLTYLYSTGLNAKGYSILNKQQEVSEGSDALDDDYENQFKENSLPDFGVLFESINMIKNIVPGEEDEFEVPSELEKQTSALVSSQAEDQDYDGIPDSWGGKKDLSYASAANALADEIENVTSLLRCSGGGCLPIPYNYAFLAPNDAIPGIAAFALGTPNPPYFGFMLPSTIPSNFRLYTMPTLTMGVGTGICAGPSTGHTSPCFAFAIPMQAIGACPNFLGPINDAIAAAKDSTSDPDIGMTTVVSDGQGSTGTEAVSGDFAYSDPDSPISAAGSVNIRIPGFPSVITNWIDKQTDEIYNKLLDLPDFYFIYPDVKTLISENAIANTNFSEIKNLHDFMSAVNSLPLIQIVGKEVLIKVPAISQAELIKWKRQAQAWIRYEEEQLDRLVEYWSCDENEHRRTLCDKVMLDTNELIQSVKKLMDKLDIIANLPREVLTWRNLESKYANQIICYLDAIMQFTGGYMRKQQKTVEAWMKAVEDVIRTFKDWKLILDLMVEYQVSCDQCKNDRFSKLGLLMQLFVAIPDPPIIPLPKWPDIIFDISQIQTGVKIIWPDLVFKPKPIVLPNLPYITFPEIPLPDLIIELPGFDIPDWILDFPTFLLPNLPDLPPLPIPDLPDLPRPPKIPKLPNLIADLIAQLKPIFRILCLLKNGLVPVPEASLATEVETLTQPTVQVVLPIIKNLGMQMPAIQYDYVEQIRVNAKMNFGIDTSFIYAIVREGAEIMNNRVEELVNNINKYTGLPWQRVIDNIINKALEEIEKSVTETIEETVEESEESAQGAVDETADASAGAGEVRFYGIQNNIENFSAIINEYSNKYTEELK